MFNEIFGKTNTQFDSAMAAGKQFNSLAVNAIEKLTAFQLERGRDYTELALEQMRAALDIKSPSDLQSYLSSRQQVVQDLGKKLQNDAKVLSELGSNVSVEAQKLAREQLTGFAPKAKKAA